MKYCEEIVREIERGLKCGLSQKSVCEGVGISQETFNQWGKKPEFSERIKKAVFDRKKLLLTKLLEHGKQHWQAIAWLLERCNPEEFALRTYQKGEQGAIQGREKLEQMSDKELEKLIAEAEMESNRRYVKKEINKKNNRVKNNKK